MIFQTIKQRLAASLLSPALSETKLRLASQLAHAVRPDGTWEDLAGGSPFAVDDTGAPAHLQRTFLLAQAGNGESGALDDPLYRALDHWLANDFQATDWRQNQLAVPRLVGSIALLADTGLSMGARGKVTEILARSRWQHWVAKSGWTDWKATTLLRVAQNVILYGCVCDVPAVFEEAFARVFGAVHIASDGEEGIQPDMIYHAARSLPSDGYEGLGFATECARFVALAHGTHWQAPAASVRVLADFLLDGQQWLLRNGVIDSNFPVKSTRRETAKLEELAAVVERLAHLGDTPRRAELAALARRLEGQSESFAGHRHFWRSGFSVHQRPAYYASVRLPWVPYTPPADGCTSRRPRPDTADGVVCVMRSGDEYECAAANPAEGRPGTTFIRVAVPVKEDEAVDPEIRLGGGVSEGDYGMAAMQAGRSGLCAAKTWFYFDHSLVCLGAGITAGGSDQPVFTSVNQCRLRGPVMAVTDLAQPRTLAPGGEHALPMVRRVVHDGITYHFAKPSRVVIRVGATTAPDQDAAAADAKPFTLWLNHGLHPQDETYAYTVLPLGEDAVAKAKVEEEVAQIEILANTAALQAVRHRGLRLLGVVFWQAGVVILPGGGRVAANQPCVLLCRETPASGKRLSIANVTESATTVHVEYAGRCLCFELPGGPDARRGVSRSL